MTLSGLEDDSLGSLGAAFSGLHVQTPESKAKEEETGKRGAKDDCEGKHERPEDVSSGDMPCESAAGETEHPAASSPAATALPATHPAALPATTTPPPAEDTGLTGTPYSTHGVKPHATEPPMAHPVSKSVASGSSYVAIHERTPCHDPDAFLGAPTGVCPPTMPAHTMAEHCFTSLSGLQGPTSCGGRKRVSQRSSHKFLARLEIRVALGGATAGPIVDLTQEIWATMEPL